MKCGVFSALKSPVDNGTYGSVIRGHLLHAWAIAVGDPAASEARWIFEGAPASIENGFHELEGIFPESDSLDWGSAPATDFEEFVNYKGVETDPEVYNTILGSCYRHDTFQLADQALQA